MTVTRPPHNPHEMAPEMAAVTPEQRKEAFDQYLAEQGAVASYNPAPALPVAAGMSFSQLLSGADAIAGFELELKENLVGIPFVITSMTFRDGTPRPDKSPTNYVSLEMVLADAATLTKRVRSGRLDAAQAEKVTPNEAVVVNDGSSGICRQAVAYLHMQGLIQCPDGTETGPSYTTRYDVYRASWVKGFDVDRPDPRFEVQLACMRGLRVSNYDSDWGPAGTFYLA